MRTDKTEVEGSIPSAPTEILISLNRKNLMSSTSKKIVSIKTRMGAFECVFTSNAPEKGYTVQVPKLRGVVTAGDTEAEAVAMAQEAIELHCACLLERGLAEVKAKRKAKAGAAVRS